jgi:hypothetical protein
LLRSDARVRVIPPLAQLCEFANLLCSAQIKSFCSCSLRDHSAVNLPNE